MYSLFKDMKKSKIMLLMLAPAVIYFFVLAYIPMAGIIIAFKNYRYDLGMFGSAWVGFNNFKFFFISGQAFNVTRNTLLYNLAFLIINNSLQIITAIFLSEIARKYFKKITQSVMFLPYFISWVIVSSILYSTFNFEHGALNGLLTFLGMEPVNVYADTGLWKYLIVGFSAWKNVGYGTVLYLAAISGIDAEMYEAAKIDGANIFHEIWNITLPCLVPTLITLVLLSISSIFRGDFQMFYQLVGDNALLLNSTDVIDTFVVRSLLRTQELGMSAAAGAYQSVLCFAIILLVNFTVRKVNKDYALF